MLKLFLVDKPICRDAIDVTTGAKAIYQMEREFYPYLTVEFLPREYNINKNPDNKETVILLAGKEVSNSTKFGTIPSPFSNGDGEVITESYDFHDPNAINNLRDLLWKYLNKNHKVKELIGKDDLPDPSVAEKDKVIDSWNKKLKSLDKNVCCKIISDAITQSYMEWVVQHPVYRDSVLDVQTNKTCKYNRLQECGNNYAPNSDVFRRCVSEVNWVCDNGYGKNNVNKVVQQKNTEISKARENIYKYLEKSGLRVDKKKFDEIITDGLFDDIGNRAGNKSSNKDIANAVDQIINEKNYFAIIKTEGFGFNYSKKYLFLIVILILIMIYYYKKH